MEKKIELALKQPENVKFEYQGFLIEVKPYLSMTEQDELSKQYIEQYFDESPEQAEFILLFAILDLCTNIMIFKDEERKVPAIMLDDLLSNWSLIQQIRTKILNYSDFYARLQANVRHLDLGKNSLKESILIGYAKISEILNDLPTYLFNLKISDEDMARVKELSDSPIVKELLKSPLLNEGTNNLLGGYTKTEIEKQPESPSPIKQKRTRKSK
jgi:hypothetical protein